MKSSLGQLTSFKGSWVVGRGIIRVIVLIKLILLVTMTGREVTGTGGLVQCDKLLTHVEQAKFFNYPHQNFWDISCHVWEFESFRRSVKASKKRCMLLIAQSSPSTGSQNGPDGLQLGTEVRCRTSPAGREVSNGAWSSTGPHALKVERAGAPGCPRTWGRRWTRR